MLCGRRDACGRGAFVRSAFSETGVYYVDDTTMQPCAFKAVTARYSEGSIFRRFDCIFKYYDMVRQLINQRVYKVWCYCVG